MAVITRLERKSRRWERVWVGDGEALASIVAGRLESEGVRTRIEGQTTPYRTAAMDLGGRWLILVPASKADLAREILREHDEGRNVLEDESGDGLTSSQKATLRVALLALLILVCAAVVAEFR